MLVSIWAKLSTSVTVLCKGSRFTDAAVSSVSALGKSLAGGFLMAGGKCKHVGVQKTFAEWQQFNFMVGQILTFSGPIDVQVGQQVVIFVTAVNLT